MGRNLEVYNILPAIRNLSQVPNLKSRYWLVMLVFSIVAALGPEAAFAAPPNQISGVICWVTKAFSGTTGRAIATVAIIAIGMLTFYGKASWGSGFIAAFGIALMFGATSILNALGAAYACPASAPFNFACVNGAAVGNIFSLNQMIDQKTDPVGAVFAHTLFFFKDTIGTVMSSMYCGFADALRGPLNAAATIFITVFGIMIITGISNLSIKEAGVLLFKLVLVWAFAMNAEWGIGVGYRFFMSFAEEASNIVIKAIPNGAGNSPSLTDPDAIISGIFTSSGSGSSAQPGIHDVPQACILWALLFLFLLLYFMPILVIFILLAIISYIGSFCRALLNYLTALVLISFLFIFAPFFLGFALFRTTQPLFTAWIKHLISFSLQMVIMFGFMALLAMLPIAAFFVEMVNILKEYDITIGHKPLTIPLHLCSVCDYTITPAQFDPVTHTSTIATIACNPHAKATAKAASDAGFILSSDGNYYVISVLNILQHSDFVIFVITQSMAIYLISKVLGDFMKKAPNMAKELSGQGVGLALGGGGTPGGLRYPGIESIQAGYMNFRKNALKFKGQRPGKDPNIKFLRNPIKYAFRNSSIARSVGEMGTRLGSGLFAGRELDKYGNPVHGSGGFFAGLVHGAFDERSQAGKERKNKLALAKKASEKAEAERKKAQALQKDAEDAVTQAREALERLKQNGASQAEIRAADKARLRLEENLKWINKQTARLSAIEEKKKKIEFFISKPGTFGETFYKGFFEVRNKSTGALMYESSLSADTYSSGDETKAAYDRLMGRHKKKQISGTLKEDNNLGFINFMKGSSSEIDKIAQSDTLYKVQAGDLKGQLMGRIDAMKQQLNSSNIPDSQKARIQAILESASNRAHFATSNAELESIARKLNAVDFG